MPNSFDQFDTAPDAATAAPAGNPFDQFHESGPNPFDAVGAGAAVPPFPELSAYNEPGIIARSLTRLRESLSPLIGETKNQQMRRHADQMSLERDMPGLAELARAAAPQGDVVAEKGIAPALVDAAFTPAPGTPQIPIKQTAPDAGKAEQIAVGVRNVGANVINSLPSPGGLAMLLGGAPARIMTAVLTPILAKHTIENAGPTIGVLRDPNATVREKTEAAGSEALTALGAALGAKTTLGVAGDAGAFLRGAEAPSADVPANAFDQFDSARNVKSAQDSAAVFEGQAAAPAITGDVVPSTAADAAQVFVEKGPIARDLAEEAQREVDTHDYLEHGDALPEMSPQAARMYDQYGRADPRTMLALGRTAAGAALGYSTGDTPEEKARNAALGALAALGAPKVLKLMRGQFQEDPAYAFERNGSGANASNDVATLRGRPADGGAAAAPGQAQAQGEAAPVGQAPGTGEYKTRGFVDSVKESPDVSPQVKDLVSGMYETKTRADVQAFAKNLVDAMQQQNPTTGLAQAKAAFLASAESPTAESWAVGLELARRYDSAGDFTQSADVLEHIAKQATTPARALNFLGTLDKMSPEGIGLYIAKVAKEAGVPMAETLTPTVKGRIADLQAAIAKTTTPETKLARQAELFEYINDLVPSTLGQKLSRGLPLALIFHTKVFVKKALGDAGQVVMRTAADNLVPALDKAYSVVTKTGRTRTWISLGDQFKGLGQPVVDFMAGFNEARGRGEDVFPSVKEGAKTMTTLARLAAKSSFLDNKTTDIRTALRHTYGSWVGRAAENIVGTGMGLPTRAAYMRAFQSRLAMEMKTAAANGAELVNPTEDMVDRAHLSGMEATFSHDNPFSKALSGTRKVLNFGQPIGIGSAIAPLTKVPGGVVDISIRYTPLGFVRAAYKGGLARVFGKADAIDRGEALDAFTQAALGTTGLVGTGYWLAQHGVIRSAPEENPDAEAVRQAAGFGKYSVNLSALKRKMVTGQWDVKDGGQTGDVITPYNWAQPIGLALAMGAELWHQRDINARAVNRQGSLKQLSALSQTMLGASRSLEDMELFTGLSRVAKDTSTYGLMPGVALQALNLPAMFIPSIFRDVRNLQDNSIRQLAVSDKVQIATNRFLERIPVLADQVGYPPQRTRFGDAMQRYDVGSNGWMNVLANPTYVTTIKADPAGAEVLRLWRESGDAAALPKAVPMTMEIHDVTGTKRTIALSPQQISDLQHWQGTLTRAYYLQLMQSPAYVRLPDDAKSKLLAQLQTAVHEAGMIAIMGDFPLDANNQVKDPTNIQQAVIAEALKSRELGDLTAKGPLIQTLKRAAGAR